MGRVNTFNMKSINNILVSVLTINLGYSQIDLSMEWEFKEDLSYFDSEALNYIVNDEISQLEFINGIIVIHQGEIVSEQYYNGSSVDQVFNIWSVTKSFTSTLIGQAIDQGLIDSQSHTLDNFLPTYGATYLQSVTLNDLLSMSSGYFDSFGYPAWVFATTQQLVWMPYIGPGTFFYNNSACHLNSHILYEGTGMTPKEFANINLFPYLGINDPDWLSGYNGISDGSASLELTLREMVKLGQLYLQDGYSGDNQIISLEWIEEATSPHATPYNWWGTINGYGYLWWLPDYGGYLAIGYAGQFIAVIPELELVMGTHSLDTYVGDPYTPLLGFMYNSIVPLFDLPDSNINHESDYYADWNLVGLPLDVEDAAYNTLFPESIDGTLYSFSDGYNSEINLTHGKGYWLRFIEEGSTTITGVSINEVTISLSEGWNLISGISTSINISDVYDPDWIIIPGTFYGFNPNGYSNTEMIEPGNSYWVKSINDGTITISNFQD